MGLLLLTVIIKQLGLNTGEEISYEKLLICTGGSPLEFQLPGSELRRTYYLRTLDDAKKIKAAAESAKEGGCNWRQFYRC